MSLCESFVIKLLSIILNRLQQEVRKIYRTLLADTAAENFTGSCMHGSYIVCIYRLVKMCDSFPVCP